MRRNDVLVRARELLAPYSDDEILFERQVYRALERFAEDTEAFELCRLDFELTVRATWRAVEDILMREFGVARGTTKTAIVHVLRERRGRRRK